MPTLCADGAGGVFLVWQDKNDDPVFYSLYGQHVGGDGELLWNGGAPLPLVVRDWDQAAPGAASADALPACGVVERAMGGADQV